MATSYPKDDIMFVPVFDEYEALYGNIGPETPLVADNGYWKDEILEQIQERGWDAYIPNKQLATLYKKPRFSKTESPFALGKEYLNLRQARARGVMQMDLQAKLTTIASNIIKINKYMWENEINT